MRKVVLAAIAGLSISSAAQAADMTLSPTLYNQEEIGSGWYIRGDVGDALLTNPTLSNVSLIPPPLNNAISTIAPVYGGTATANTVVFGAGFGYQFNPWFRMDATFDHFNQISFSHGNTVVCPYGATTVYQQNPVGTFTLDANGNQIPAGLLYDPTNTCNGQARITNTNNVGLVNAYLDIPMGGGFVPYVGAGAGLNYFYTTGAQTYNRTTDGGTYAANLTPGNGVPAVWVNSAGVPVTPAPAISFNAQNWNRTLTQTKMTMAIALMAGVTYHVNDWIALDLGYRYLNADVGNFSSNYSSEVRAGIRLYAN